MWGLMPAKNSSELEVESSVELDLAVGSLKLGTGIVYYNSFKIIWIFNLRTLLC